MATSNCPCRCTNTVRLKYDVKSTKKLYVAMKTEYLFSSAWFENTWKSEENRLRISSVSWNDVVEIISTTSLPPTKKFLIRYTFQATVHALWRERNARRYGEQLQTVNVITKFVDKTIRLKLLSVKGLGQKYLEESLTTWFATRERPP
ncbi:unnamed protein product [Brassica oleracea]